MSDGTKAFFVKVILITIGVLLLKSFFYNILFVDINKKRLVTFERELPMFVPYNFERSEYLNIDSKAYSRVRINEYKDLYNEKYHGNNYITIKDITNYEEYSEIKIRIDYYTSLYKTSSLDLYSSDILKTPHDRTSVWLKYVAKNFEISKERQKLIISIKIEKSGFYYFINYFVIFLAFIISCFIVIKFIKKGVNSYYNIW